MGFIKPGKNTYFVERKEPKGIEDGFLEMAALGDEDQINAVNDVKKYKSQYDGELFVHNMLTNTRQEDVPKCK